MRANICAVRLPPRRRFRQQFRGAVGGAGEEAADGGVGGLRLLFEEEVAGAVDRDDFGAREVLAEAGEDPAREDALVGGPEDEDGLLDAAVVDALLALAIAKESGIRRRRCP